MGWLRNSVSLVKTLKYSVLDRETLGQLPLVFFFTGQWALYRNGPFCPITKLLIWFSLDFSHFPLCDVTSIDSSLMVLNHLILHWLFFLYMESIILLIGSVGLSIAAVWLLFWYNQKRGAMRNVDSTKHFVTVVLAETRISISKSST